jgi:hypothetical protein
LEAVPILYQAASGDGDFAPGNSARPSVFNNLAGSFGNFDVFAGKEVRRLQRAALFPPEFVLNSFITNPV